nr:hypothetical protein [Acrocarpospora pleiomorpha]
MSGLPYRRACKTTGTESPWKAGRPGAAYTIVAPQLKTSAAGPTSPDATCSGAM